METIIDPIDINLIKEELTPEKKLRDTNKGGNEIYVIDWKDSPNTLQEIGRLREITFRSSGGGTGLAVDIDEFDLMEKPCKQLIIWDPDAQAIIGGYRYILGPDITLKEDGQPRLATSHLFKFSDIFIRNYLPHVIELGRSFVTPDYQSSKSGAKGLFALDNLWDGLATLMILHPTMTWYFGKVTMYPSYDRCGRDLILHFFWKHFEDKDELIRPIKPVSIEHDARLMNLILKADEVKADYRLLKEAIHSLGTTIPPLVNSYMNTSPTLKMFGTAINDEFGYVEETGILVHFDELYTEKKARHVESYLMQKIEEMKKRFPQLEEGIEQKLYSRWNLRRERAQNKINLK